MVYYVLDPDYNLSMDIQQQINLTLVRKLDELGVSSRFLAHAVRRGNRRPLHTQVQLLEGGRGERPDTPKAIEKAKHTLPDYSTSPACCDPPIPFGSG